MIMMHMVMIFQYLLTSWWKLLQVESTQGTPLANVADVSVEIKADSTAMAEQYLNQISALLQDYTTMSVSAL